ncbi:MAG: hypothetical protein ACI93T_000127 [Porticoccaceae bacterium]|jgi:hypothetical protein
MSASDPKRSGHSFSNRREGSDYKTGHDDQPDDSQGVPEPRAEGDAPGILVVVAVRETLQEYERDEEQRDDKMDSVHESKRECSIAESNFLGGFLLRKQTGKPIRLKDDKRDANDKSLKHSPSKQALPFAADVIAGCLQTHAAKYQQHGADRKRWRKEKATFRRNEGTGSDHQPRTADRHAHRRRREKKECQREITSSLQKSVQRFLGHGRPHGQFSKS